MTDAPTETAPSPADEWQTYHERRELAVVQPLGSLALVNTQVVDSEQTIWGVPGRWAPLPAGESGLKVIAEAADGIHVDGVLVDGEAIVRGKDDPNPGDVVFSPTVRGFVIAQQGGGYALRVWDAESEGIRTFGGIDAFPYDPAVGDHRVLEREPRGHDDGIRAPQRRGDTREEVVPGRITFSHDGAEYDIAAFKSGRALQLVFADATNGDSTYSVGRFLYVAPERRRHHHARLQPRRYPAVRLQLRVQLPAAAEAEPLPVRGRGGREARAGGGRLAAASVGLGCRRLHPASPVRRRLGCDPRPPYPRRHRHPDRLPRDARAGPGRRRGGRRERARRNRHAAKGEPASDSMQVVAIAPDGRWIGSMVCFVSRGRARLHRRRTAWTAAANLVGVYVDPEWRGDAGVMDALLGEIARWAGGRRASASSTCTSATGTRVRSACTRSGASSPPGVIDRLPDDPMTARSRWSRRCR